MNSAIGNTVRCAFKQFGAMCMHNHDEIYPPRPGFASRLQAPSDPIEP